MVDVPTTWNLRHFQVYFCCQNLFVPVYFLCSSLQMEITKGNTRRFTVYKWISWGFPVILTFLLFVTVFVINKTYSLHSGILFNQFNKFKYRYNCFITRWELSMKHTPHCILFLFYAITWFNFSIFYVQVGARDYFRQHQFNFLC